MAELSSKAPSPVRELLRQLASDRRELIAVFVYSVLSSLMLLAIPLAAQGLVNVTAAGLPVQPLIVLTTALFAGLLFAGLFNVLRYYLVEVTQERIFCRVALKVSERLPKVHHRTLSDSSGPELMNRFFDVINIQKSWFKLIYEGPGAVLEVLFGLSLLLLYGMDLFLLALGCIGVGALLIFLAGYDGLRSSIAESTQKYRVVAWLEEMVRCRLDLRLNSRLEFWSEETDRRVVDYIKERRRHFRVLLRQNIIYYLFLAITMSAVLGMGGAMVISQQLTLGQLVAAELVIWSVLKATEKLIRLTENFYDLLTGLNKVSIITNLPLETLGTTALTPNTHATKVRVDQLCTNLGTEQNNLFTNLCFQVEAGAKVTILGPSGCGKSALIRVLAGLAKPKFGAVELDGVDVREISPESLQQSIALVSSHQEIFAGSVWDNIATGRISSLHQVREILQKCGGQRLLNTLPQGIQTHLTSSANRLSASQKDSILLSRALLGKPRLLLLDECLWSFSEPELEELCQQVFDTPEGPTIISTVSHPTVVRRCQLLLILKDGKLAESGNPRELARRGDSLFSQLYPNLARGMVTKT